MLNPQETVDIVNDLQKNTSYRHSKKLIETALKRWEEGNLQPTILLDSLMLQILIAALARD